MPRSITPAELARSIESIVSVDVRRDAARASSGMTIPGAERTMPDGLHGTTRWAGRPVVVFCVHGHEVSQDACRGLVAAGIDARYLEGGFEAWCEAGLATVRIEVERR